MTPYYADDWLTVYQGDCRDVMASMEPESVHCVITSPPYWGLRDYGTATWIGGDEGCDHRIGRVMSNANKGAVRDVLDGDRYRCSCGATRQDSQLGLEPTPEEYVANMVAVFREVRRVLRADGTVWLNLGDSYAGGAQTGRNDGGRPEKGRGWAEYDIQRTKVERRDGLKPKDLVGIPWRVAFALQQPYYTGTIRDEKDRIWLAAMLDAEGCLFIQKRKAGQHNGQGYYRTNDNYGPGVEISNTSLAVIERIMALVGKGSISTQGPDETGGRRKQRIYRWNLRTTECRDFVRELYPYLVAKQQQARILIGCPSSGERAEAAHGALMALHRTGLSDVDFPAPASMLEPGWYLRSDIIWSKNNPMPESVTDRPTKAHEYLFLLSKSARYFYDAEAVRERAESGPSDLRKMAEGRERIGGKHKDLIDPLSKASALTNIGRKRSVGGKQLATVEHGVGNGHHVAGFNDRWDASEDLGTAPIGRNLRSVWTVATQPYPGAHFATFPEKLIEPCIKAGCPPDGTVLDPFAGSGTTGRVAQRLSRRAVLIDLNADYLVQAMARNASIPLGLESA